MNTAGIWKQAVGGWILVPRSIGYVTIFRVACSRGIVRGAGGRGGEELSTIKTIRGWKNRNSPSALAVIGRQGGFAVRNKPVMVAGMVSNAEARTVIS